ncbi:MAG: hypothetical protein JWO98_3295 [Frankiales bacterium]|nr:hypothetical protein [Frankiales bacterium]
MSAQEFMSRTAALLERVRTTQESPIREAGRAFADAVRGGHDVWAFGTGHSHLIAEELYARAGGWAGIRAVLEPALMLHEGVAKSSLMERLPGLAEVLLEVHPVAAGDVVIVVSNSGINAVPVEFAAGARARGATVVALTSLAHSATQEPRTASGRRLADEAHIVIDNCGVPGDAIVEIPGSAASVGSTSTVIGALVVEAIVSEAAALFAEAGIEPPILRSNNIAGAAEHNARLRQRLTAR